MRLLLLVAACCALGGAACGDNDDPNTPHDAAPADAAIDAPDSAVPLTGGPCIDRPTDLPRPPTGPLSCDLLPPGFEAP